ncbi:hypothetical protein C8Q80DRAFT_1203335 [Daedaleopsis nitida]|nr:hypothetical protein C8Q80DRAFT_1203335 [Daedaleopsis nitida]
MNYRSICDLPPEIIHPILLQLRQNTEELPPIDLKGNINIFSDSIHNCSLTCKYLRDLAVEHFPHNSYRLNDQESVDGFMRFLRKHPRVPPTIGKFDISTSAGADSVVVTEAVITEMVKEMSGLQELRLSGIHLYSAAPSPDARSGLELEAASESPPLVSLSYFSCRDSQFSLSALCRVLALFDIGTCHLQTCVVDRDAQDTESNPLTRSLRLRALKLDTDTTIAEALSKHLATGLQELCAPIIVSPNDTKAVGLLLSGPGREISHLTLGHWKCFRSECDPLSQWQDLRIESCANLQYFDLSLFFRADSPDGIWYSTPIANIFAHAASSLRRVMLRLHGGDDPAHEPHFEDLRKLVPIDEVLADDRFAQLEEVRVDSYNLWIQPHHVEQSFLRRLHQKNLLKWNFY